MSEKDKAQLVGWAIGLLTAISLSLAGWSLHRSVALGEQTAVNKQELSTNERDHREIKDELKTIRELLQKRP